VGAGRAEDVPVDLDQALKRLSNTTASRSTRMAGLTWRTSAGSWTRCRLPKEQPTPGGRDDTDDNDVPSDSRWRLCPADRPDHFGLEKGPCPSKHGRGPQGLEGSRRLSLIEARPDGRARTRSGDGGTGSLSKVAVSCRECGSPVGKDAKFCAECGARLLPTGETAEDVRKTVTALFCDLVGSTSLGERTDPEKLRAVLERYFTAMRAALEQHGGTVEKFIGDAVVAFFGVPTTREDDALRAVRAAFDMLKALGELNPELRERWDIELAVRIGVNTGEVLVTGSAGQTVGDAVNVAARLEQAAGAGEVFVGETTWRLVRQWADGESVTPLELKGKEQALPAWRVRSVTGVTDAPHAEGILQARLVGRDRELALLRQSFERAEADRSCQLFTLFGSAGVGKSRLTSEFLATQTPEVRVLASRCLSYGDGTSLWPLLEMLRASAGLTGGEDAEGRARLAETYGDNPDAKQVTELLAPLAGLGGTPAAIEEVQWAIRRFVEALARSGPVIWVVEDLHWAEPALLAIVDDVVDWTRDAAVLVLCQARPEFLDDHAAWGGGKLNVTNVLLASKIRPTSGG
jgi:class 3 adenylate cyclase